MSLSVNAGPAVDHPLREGSISAKCGVPRLLAPDLAHGTGCPHETGIVDAVLELFVTNGKADQLGEPLVARSVPQRRLQIPLAAREQARAELAVRGQADPVAIGAERLRDRVDEAELALSVGEAEPA